MKPIVRVSDDEDGERIHELLVGMGFKVEGLNWRDISGYWLVAEMEDRIVGCVQLILGKPVGWLELLAVDEALSHMARARTVKLLAEKGIIGLRLFGASAVMASIPFELESYRSKHGVTKQVLDSIPRNGMSAASPKISKRPSGWATARPSIWSIPPAS